MNPIIRQMLLGKQQGLVKRGLVEYWDFMQGVDPQVLYGKHVGINGTLGANSGVDSADPTIGVQGYTFGGDDYISVADTPPLRLTNKFTIGIVFKSNNLAQTNKYLLSKENNYAFLYEYTNNAVELYAFGYAGDNPRTGSAITISDTNFHHVVYSYDGSVLKGYSDMTKQVDVGKVFTLATGDKILYFGSSGPVADFVEGTIAFIYINNVGLTFAELQQNHKHFKRSLAGRGIVLP